MKKVSILTDSTSDLSKELLDKYDITVFPLHIHLGDKEYADGIDITPEEIYRWSEEQKEIPKTSALSLYDAKEYLKKALEKSEEVIVFCISETMSSCCSVMHMAVVELEAEDKVFVVDSKNLSTGIGLQVIEAAIMAAEGHSGAQIAAHIEEIIPRVRASFVIDTLKFLHRGGRCSGMAAFAGTALKLHPKIVVSEGKMTPTKKYMGNISRVVMNYVKDMEKNLKNAETDRVFITHSGCSKAIVSEVRAYLEELGIFREIHETRAGCVISSHCGPNTLGVLFIEKA